MLCVDVDQAAIGAGSQRLHGGGDVKVKVIVAMAVAMLAWAE
jgi:hypothetical protein